MRFRLKKLDLLILRSFMGPFVVTFFLVLFAFTMQFYWLYMDELIGKGLGIGLTLKLMLYMSGTLVPIALPLGILLAGIMTFGNLGENFELVAIKSSGISLFRFMRPLIIFIGIISVLAFFFNNYVIPVANLKSYSLLYDMRKQRPAMNIKAGIFNKEIDGYAIRVGVKGSDGQTIKDVIIYDHTGTKGNKNVVVAEEGKMYPTPNNRYLIFELHNGWHYEEDYDGTDYHQTRMHFGRWYKVFDLSKFAFSRTKEELFRENEEMMNVQQLNANIDTMQRRQLSNIADIHRYFVPYLSIYGKTKEDSMLSRQISAKTADIRSYRKTFLERIPTDLRGKVVSRAETSLRNLDRVVGIVANDYDLQKAKINKFKIVWHKKYTLSFACMLLFLIGAPLGAIIRKGGLGMPVIIAIGFFIIYFIISSTGEKLAQQGAVAPWYGMWLATGILLPIALVIMVAARNDSSIFNKEWYLRGWWKLKKLFVKKTPVHE